MAKNTRLVIQISIFLCDYWLMKAQKMQLEKFFWMLISKNKYKKIDNIFSATKALIPNDAEPLGIQHRNSKIKND